MLHTPPPIRNLIREFNRLPGIGQRTSERFVYHLLKGGTSIDSLAAAIERLHSIRRCNSCFTYTEDQRCSICTDPSRNQALICVVAEARDLAAIEQTGSFDGVYHVLGGVIDHNSGIGPRELRIDELVGRVEAGGVREVILATNPDSEGETTALTITQLLKTSGVTLTRIARGLPSGADIEFADELTLTSAMTARRVIN